MEKIIWTKLALQDLKSIYLFIAQDSDFYAIRLIQQFIQRVDQLLLFPDSGRMVPEKEDSSIRELIEGNYRIFYKKSRKNIVILRIHHSSKKIS